MEKPVGCSLPKASDILLSSHGCSAVELSSAALNLKRKHRESQGQLSRVLLSSHQSQISYLTQRLLRPLSLSPVTMNRRDVERASGLLSP